MKTVRWYCSVGLVGCRIHGSVRVEDDATPADIDSAIMDEVLNRIEWGPEDDDE